ncbi:MAG: hypothetical protein SFY80_05005 [Verrucomicrobiota bacterium]|nr:hypothetical protein [Verrucomicrobiota bacterium]
MTLASPGWIHGQVKDRDIAKQIPANAIGLKASSISVDATSKPLKVNETFSRSATVQRQVTFNKHTFPIVDHRQASFALAKPFKSVAASKRSIQSISGKSLSAMPVKLGAHTANREISAKSVITLDGFGRQADDKLHAPSMQDINRYNFRADHSPKPGLKVTKAGGKARRNH